VPASIPPYPSAHGLLAGRTVVVTAAAGTGIGFAVAKRCAEEGARILISDIHERRLGEAAERLAEVCGEVLHRALRESQQVPALARRLERLVPQSVEWPAPAAHTPLLLTRLRSSAGELALFSVFSSFGAPMDVTLASLRIEHLFAADAATHAALMGAGP
jgi:NAD(P)-dependent dehydrogenase (short-subunit alcohol dehydrogenase family)